MQDHRPPTFAPPADETEREAETRRSALMRQFFMDECGQPEMAAKLLDVAMRLFARKGYAATSVREIVGEAQSTSPTLYYYFQSKEGLFLALVRTLIGSFNAQLDHAMERDCPLREKLSDITSRHLQMSREFPAALRFMLSTSLNPETLTPARHSAAQSVELLTKVSRLFEDAIERGELELREGLTPMYLAQTFMGMLTSQLLFTTKLADLQDLPDELCGYIRQYTSDKSAQSMIQLFFSGAGTLHEPTP